MARLKHQQWCNEVSFSNEEIKSLWASLFQQSTFKLFLIYCHHPCRRYHHHCCFLTFISLFSFVNCCSILRISSFRLSSVLPSSLTSSLSSLSSSLLYRFWRMAFTSAMSWFKHSISLCSYLIFWRSALPRKWESTQILLTRYGHHFTLLKVDNTNVHMGSQKLQSV